LEVFSVLSNEEMAGGVNDSGFVGQVIQGKYRVLRKLGEGGFGDVYLAEHVDLGRRFALKVLHRDLERRGTAPERFQREARLTASLNHPNIVQVTDFGRDQALGTFFVMEFLEGEDLLARLRKRGPYSSAEAVGIMRQVVDAFVYAHGRGVVHRDVKSANVFLARDARGEAVKVLDFGIARLDQESEGSDGLRLTQTGQVMGSPAYMAPEQALNLPVDHRTDIYALGIVLYELVTGSVPFKGGSALATLNKQVSEAPTPPSEIVPNAQVNPFLELVILKCLQKRMDDRFQTTRELAEALETAAARIREGVDAAPEVLTTLHDLRTTMLQEGALLAASAEQEQRRLVGGRGYSTIMRLLGRGGARRAWLLATLALAALALAGVVAWVAMGGLGADQPVRPPETVAPAPVPALAPEPQPEPVPEPAPEPRPEPAPETVSETAPETAPGPEPAPADVGAAPPGFPASTAPPNVVPDVGADQRVRPSAPPAPAARPAPRAPKPAPKPAADPYGGI
jgi:serine/threonine-protein kinase